MYDTPLNLVLCLLAHNLFMQIFSLFFVYPITSFGITVYPHLNPVNPAVFEKLLISIATFEAPSISYIVCTIFFYVINASYAAS